MFTHYNAKSVPIQHSIKISALLCNKIQKDVPAGTMNIDMTSPLFLCNTKNV